MGEIAQGHGADERDEGENGAGESDTNPAVASPFVGFGAGCGW